MRILDNTSGDAAVGMISYFRTGNIIVDMVIAMLIPLFIRSLFEGAGRNALAQAWNRLISLVRCKANHECVRTISHVAPGRYGGLQMDQRNELLQKALALYLTEVVKVKFKGKAQVALTALHDVRTGHMMLDRFNPLENYRLSWLAPEGEWVEVCAEERIDFRMYTQSMPGSGDGGGNNGESKSKEQVIFELRKAGRDASTTIDAFIQKAVAWYKAEVRRQRDDSRYLYVQVLAERFSISSTDSKDDDACKYKRYKLSDHKTFDSLFFEDKKPLLSLLDDFEHKRGKFAKAGFPHKVGLLLHGPPGTGKTSLIKALAHATNRSIVSIPLAQIKTNQMLMDVMYDLKLKVDGHEAPALEFRDVIFVIEDVDAASKIVLRRDGPDAKNPTDAPLTAEQARAFSGLAAKVAGAAPKSEVAAGDDEAVEGPKPPTMSDMVESYFKPRPDELNLAGLLNVLDGVVDTPGRLLILTSNHPEALDPALIRPGRIDRLIHLGYLKAPAAVAMLEHYFDETPLEARQRERLEALFTPTAAGDEVRVTPAMLEALCAQHNTIDSLLDALKAEVQASSTGVTAPEPERKVKADGPDLVEIKRQVSGG